MKNLSLLVLFLGLFGHSFANDSLSVLTPTTRIVYQRNNDNKAIVPVKGSCPAGATSIEARLVAREKGQGVSTGWVTIDNSPVNGSFSGTLTGQGGWYNLEVRAKKKRKKIAHTTLERVGIGEVFVIAGHSVAQGGDINMEGSTDDRVSVVQQLNEKSDTNQMYLKTADTQYLPAARFVQAGTGVAPAPFGHSSYFWSKFAEHVAKKENVPVLIFNAAFGGTSLEHWAKSAKGIQFEHGFVKSSIRMPYVNVLNTFKKYISITGIRAILADQGQNDNRENDPNIIFDYYQTFIRQAREDLGYPELALVVNQQSPPNGNTAVRIAQERMIKEPYSFPGPDYDTGLRLKEDHVDNIHLNASGLPKAAQMWSDALTPQFFSQSKPWLPSQK